MKSYAIVSYWYGTSDECRYAEESKIEKIVVSDDESKVVTLSKEISAKYREESSRFCYNEIEEVTIEIL